MATYLVTGAAGMIGSKVAELLLGRGDEVVGVDDLCASYDVRLKEWRLAQLAPVKGFHFWQSRHFGVGADGGHFRRTTVRRPASLRWGHQPGSQGRRGRQPHRPWAFFRSNVTGTLNLLEQCRRYGVGKFVLASTSSLYGVHNPQPFREDANTDVLLSPYAASKKAAEALCSTYHHLYA